MVREYQVCLVDYRFGERSGVELIREAREAGLTTPMILLTKVFTFEIALSRLPLTIAINSLPNNSRAV
jgi:DNA-binding NtrC family response regulator